MISPPAAGLVKDNGGMTKGPPPAPVPPSCAWHTAEASKTSPPHNHAETPPGRRAARAQKDEGFGCNRVRWGAMAGRLKNTATKSTARTAENGKPGDRLPSDGAHLPCCLPSKNSFPP